MLVHDYWRGFEVELLGQGDSRTLILSMRRLADLVGYCATYEFEDVSRVVTAAEVAIPANLEALELSRRAYKLVRYLSQSGRLAAALAPRRGALRLERDYDFFLPIFNHPYELYALSAISGWRERCRYAACYICEAWPAQLPSYLLELLGLFDHIYIGVKATTEAVGQLAGRPCTYVPMGVDALGFCPFPGNPPRLIDVCGIGRRSPVTHRALRELALRKGFFYYHDTIRSSPQRGSATHITFRVTDPPEHRRLLSSILKRSRYFIANRAWADKPELTQGQDEIATRFYEGAAAGTIMLGEPPATDDFRTQFPWEDAVIRTPFDAPEIGETIAMLDADPARSARIRTEGVANSLLRHDWVYRLRTLLEAADRPIPAGLLEREEALRRQAAAVRQAAAS